MVRQPVVFCVFMFWWENVGGFKLGASLQSLLHVQSVETYCEKRSLQENEERKTISGQTAVMTKSRWCVTIPSIGEVEKQLRKLKEEMQTHPAQPNSISLNIVAQCGLNEEAFSGHRFGQFAILVLDFLYSFTCFFYALKQHALPLSPKQYFILVSRSAAKKLVGVQRFAYLFRITPPSASLSSSKAHGYKALTSLFSTKQV